MVNTDQLTADFVRAGIRANLAKSKLNKAKADVKDKNRAASRALHKAVRVQASDKSIIQKQAADEEYLTAEQAAENADGTFRGQKKTARRVDEAHTDAYNRLKAAQKAAGPAPTTPFEFQFAETMPAFPRPLQRSGSKKYKFESAFDGWRREVDEAFEDYSKIEIFPAPPGKCRALRCQADKKASICRCVIKEAFGKVEDLEAELKRWHPDRFAVCAADKRKTFQNMAEEVCMVVSEMIQKQKPAKVSPRVMMSGALRPSRFGLF